MYAENSYAEESLLINVFIAGDSGRIGSELLKVLERQTESISSQHGLHFSVSGKANTRGLYFHGRGFSPRKRGDWEVVAGRLAAGPSVFVDCSASEEVAATYPHMLAQGIAVVTPNKLAFSGSFAQYHLLHALSIEHDAPLLYNTTVGAALPVIEPLKELAARGEQPVRIEAVLSGTLSYLFARINQGATLSHAVREAWELGYTEPHPARDLGGEDAARKLVILLRAAGYPIEPEEVAVEPMVPKGYLEEPDPARFVGSLAMLDRSWRARAACGPLACIARYANKRASVERVSVMLDSPFARLEPRANLVQVHTRHYDSLPLAISGPGAGVGITTAGVSSDLIEVGKRLRIREAPNRRNSAVSNNRVSELCG